MKFRISRRLFECAAIIRNLRIARKCVPYLTCPPAEGRADDGGRNAFAKTEGAIAAETPVLTRRAGADGGATFKKAAGGTDGARGGAGCVANFHPTSAGTMAAKKPLT